MLWEEEESYKAMWKGELSWLKEVTSCYAQALPTEVVMRSTERTSEGEYIKAQEARCKASRGG